jgi:hypothetical protein
MSDNVVDLFDKAALIHQRANKHLRKVQEFAESIDHPGRPLGCVFAQAIRYSIGVLTAVQSGGMSYGYQIRTAQDARDLAKIYFTGRSVLQRTLAGRQDRPWEVFQVRLQPRRENVEPRPWAASIGISERYTQWLGQQDLRYSPTVCAAFWLVGSLMSPKENYWIESFKTDGPIFEVQLASYNALARVRIYAEALRSDDTALVEAGILTSMEPA